MDYIDEYWVLISQYRKKLQELRKAERRHEDSSVIYFIDKERNSIHNKLRVLAPKVSKSANDITIDILESENDLSEYLIPEFKLVRSKNAFAEISWICVNDFGQHGPWNAEVEKEIKSSTVFIPFGQQEFYHLFDSEGYPMRQAEELEYRRRLDKLVSLIPSKCFSVDIYSGKTFHQGTLLYGLAFYPDDLDRVLAAMREHRSEISIDKRYLDENQIKKDVLVIANEDISYIKKRGPGEAETVFYLICMLAHNWNYSFRFPENTKEPINDLFIVEARKARIEACEAKKELELQQVNQEIETDLQRWDRAERDHPQESKLPNFEPMKRKLF